MATGQCDFQGVASEVLLIFTTQIYSLSMHYCKGIDKKGVLQPEYTFCDTSYSSIPAGNKTTKSTHPEYKIESKHKHLNGVFEGFFSAAHNERVSFPGRLLCIIIVLHDVMSIGVNRV